MLKLWFQHALEIFIFFSREKFYFPLLCHSGPGTVLHSHRSPGDLENRVSGFLLHPSLDLSIKGSRFSENPE